MTKEHFCQFHISLKCQWTDSCSPEVTTFLSKMSHWFSLYLCHILFYFCISVVTMVLCIWTAAPWILNRSTYSSSHLSLKCSQVCPPFKFSRHKQMEAIQPHIQLSIWLLKNPEMKRDAVFQTVRVNLLGCNTCSLICSACLWMCSFDLLAGGPVGQHMEDVHVCI